MGDGGRVLGRIGGSRKGKLDSVGEGVSKIAKNDIVPLKHHGGQDEFLQNDWTVD